MIRFNIKSVTAGMAVAALASACSATDAKVADSTTTESSYQVSRYDGGEMTIGSGQVVSKAIAISGAQTLEIDAPISLTVRQGSTPSLTIEAEDNIVDFVTTTNEDGVLSIKTTGSYRSRIGMKGVITLPDMQTVAITSSGSAELEGWRAPRLSMVIGGSGDIVLNGAVDTIKALIGGSGEIDFSSADVSEADVMISGSGDVRTGSMDRLAVDVNGSGTVRSGDLGSLRAAVNGSGDILYKSVATNPQLRVNGSGSISTY